MPFSLLAFGSLVAKRTPIAGRPGVSDSIRTLVATTISSKSLVESPVKSSMPDSGAGVRWVTFETVVQAAVDLQLGDRAEPEAQAKRGHPKQVTLQAGDRKENLLLQVEAAFEEDQPRADGFRIFGDERALLRRGRRRQRQRENETSHEPFAHRVSTP